MSIPARIWLAAAVSLCTVACKDDASNADRATATAKRSDQAPAPASDDRPSIVFLGDSLTAGRGLAADQAMPALIEERVRGAGLDYRVINAGRSGDTSAGGLARLDWYLRPEVNLEVLAVNLGSNDAMRGLPLDELEQNLRAIVSRTRHARSDAVILLFQMRTFPNLGRDYAGAYREVFARVAEDTSASLLPFPLRGIAGNPELNQADGIHPTAEGTRRMADNVWRALAPHLGVSVADSGDAG